MQTLKLQLSVYRLYFHRNLKKCSNLVFSCTDLLLPGKLHKWGKFLPQRTPSIRCVENYPHKNNLDVLLLLKIGDERREITLLFLDMFLKNG